MLDYNMTPQVGIHILMVVFLLFVTGCGHADVAGTEVRSGDSVLMEGGSSGTQNSSVLNDPHFQQAQLFDALLFEKLPLHNEEEAKKLKAECRTPKTENPFCPAVKKLSKLKKVLARKRRVYSPPPTKPLNPAMPNFSKGKLTNLRSLRKAQVPNLLKGLLVLPFDQLKLVGELSLKEKRCPNNLSVAVAATLEDYLPKEIDLEFLAKLYAQAAKCSKKMPVDREHFLTRAGLLYLMNKDPKTALSFFAKVNPVDALSGRSLYWLYRTKQMLGDTAGAMAAHQRLLSHHRFSFHALIAAQLEKKDIGAVLAQTLSFPTRSKRLKKINPIIEGAEILKRLGFEGSAAILVDWLLDEYERLEPELKITLVKLGDDRARVTAMPSILLFHPELICKESMELDFPKAYFALFEKHKGNLSPYLLLAVARRESSFNPKAVSPANAQGLLQLNPDTVRTMLADKAEQAFPELLDPETNIGLGARYLTEVLAKMNGSVPKALAAYNAGEAPVQTWEKRYLTEDPILWMDLIPYRETRDYVANVLSSYYWYLRIYENSGAGNQVIPLPNSGN